MNWVSYSEAVGYTDSPSQVGGEMFECQPETISSDTSKFILPKIQRSGDNFGKQLVSVDERWLQHEEQ